MPTKGQIRQAISLLEGTCRQYGIRDAFLVGGYPRAIAMGLPMTEVHDLDIASGTPEKASQLAGFVYEAAGEEKYKVHHRTMAVTIEVGGVEMDFQGPASHDDAMPYMHAWGVDATPIARNVFDRDFTINSLAIPIGGDEVLDLTRRGMTDIEEGRIATILPADFSVPRDPLVITRAVRFAAKFGFRIDGPLWKAMLDNAGGLSDESKLSKERLAIEAFVLSKYDVGEMLGELGLEFLGSPEWARAGEAMRE
jgi:poly(A) polymerase